MGPQERVRELVEPLLAERGLEVVDCEFVASKADASTLRVSVDRTGGVDLDAIAAATEVVSRALDEADPVPGGRYTLEVSSPGIERPLRTPAHFRRFVGATVAVKTAPSVEGDRRLQGRLEAADDDGVVVAGRRLAYADVASARTVFEWGPAPKPGQRKPSAAKKPASSSPDAKVTV